MFTFDYETQAIGPRPDQYPPQPVGLAFQNERDRPLYLAFGHLTGKYLDGHDTDGRISRWPAFGQRYSKPNVVPAVTAYVALAARHGLRPTQLALGFVRSRWFVSSTIIGASSLAQLQETLQATQTPMSPELLGEIDAIHLRYTNPAP